MVIIASFSAVLEEQVVIGAGTSIGEKSRIRKSVIGRNCKIGANVTIDGAYIWDNVTIDDDCTVSKSIVAEGVHLKAGVEVKHGCLICKQVVIGPSVILPHNTKLTLHSGEADSDGEEPESDVAVVGVEGRGIVYQDGDDEDDEDDDDIDPRNIHLGTIGAVVFRDLFFISVIHSLIAGREFMRRGSRGSFSESDDSEGRSDGDFTDAHDTEDEADWPAETKATFQRAVDENHTVEIAALELNTLKMGMNISFSDLRSVVIPSIVDLIDPTIPPVKMHSQHCVEKEAYSKLFLQLVRTMYEVDVVEEDSIIRWFDEFDLEGDADIKVKESNAENVTEKGDAVVLGSTRDNRNAESQGTVQNVPGRRLSVCGLGNSGDEIWAGLGGRAVDGSGALLEDGVDQLVLDGVCDVVGEDEEARLTRPCRRPCELPENGLGG
ncbi:hypothetical protein BDK51DRAFT_45688 [Blyttiomyces helicus]|uniref:Uncharacterized protein n=1 Tax=Blyttiomyces helicus TaxID=388810 RepID=A0A4P9W349_9FUNG|nr:hypothetical protein BDK51DRAFT_45688 [Blyttiomyces helicus]|eukprot:RKO86719.1 hypothetical protein BDK51DRAFT_45688 [Blyttiomyces helicus]